MSVGAWFREFCGSLTVPAEKRSTIGRRNRAITRRLNLAYWDSEDESLFNRYVGSYGRGTAVGWFSDVDTLHILPQRVKDQYDAYRGNGQSALLQAVRNHIRKTYSSTDVGADGQVVVVVFSDGTRFEVVPAFKRASGEFWIPDSNSGGQWRTTNPEPEIEAIRGLNGRTNGNLVNLARMARAWRDEWSVPIKGLLIDTLAYEFLSSWEYADKSYDWYDFMSRDFFDFLAAQNTDTKYWFAPGSYDLVWRMGAFEYKARTCARKARQAIKEQTDGLAWTPKQTWREIYGGRFPA